MYEDKQLPELYFLKHFNDNIKEKNFDYPNQLFRKTIPSYVYFSNDKITTFLNSVQKMVLIWFDNVNIIRNFRNYLVDKDYYGHND